MFRSWTQDEETGKKTKKRQPVRKEKIQKDPRRKKWFRRKRLVSVTCPKRSDNKIRTANRALVWQDRILSE